jgi:hypothetical protein
MLMLFSGERLWAGAGLCLDVARHRSALGPADRRRGTDLEYTRHLPRTLAFLGHRDGPHPQTPRVSLAIVTFALEPTR